MPARAASTVLLLAFLGLAGCSQPGASPVAGSEPAATPPVPAMAPLVEQAVDLSGTILLRPAGRPILFTGDDPAFYIEVPNGTTSIVAHAEWSPDQVMGLEFHPPGDDAGDHAVRSWTFPNHQVLPPIDLRVDQPGPGAWWCYFGPSTVGGGADWNMTLRFTLPAGSQAALTPES